MSVELGWYGSYVFESQCGRIVHGVVQVVASNYEEALGRAYLELEGDYPSEHIRVTLDENPVWLAESLDHAVALIEGTDEDCDCPESAGCCDDEMVEMVADLEASGLIETGPGSTPAHPVYQATDKGLAMAVLLCRRLEEGRQCSKC